jgi:hypothetical protein
MQIIATKFVRTGLTLSMLAASVVGAQARNENQVSQKIWDAPNQRMVLTKEIDFCRTGDAAYYELLSDCMRLAIGHTIELLGADPRWLKVKVVTPDNDGLVGYVSRYEPEVSSRPDLNGVNW